MLSVLAKDNFQERRVEVLGGRGDLARREMDVVAESGKETFLPLLFPGVP